MSRFPRVLNCCASVAVALLAQACTPPFSTTVESGNTSVSLAQLPEDRFAMVRAVDVLLFDANELSCATLLRSRLGDPNLRRRTGGSPPERVRLCSSNVGQDEERPQFQLLGRVAEGRKSVLVTASYLDHECRVSSTMDGEDAEVGDPGLVLGAGCEEAEVEGGKITRTRVVVFPFRDPGP